jgi:hypothetical protein
MAAGNCYVTSEAVYHLLGGKARGWTPIQGYHEGTSHWALRSRDGRILDLTAKQFKRRPHYEKFVGRGFMTRKPSRRAKELMELMLWAQVGINY